TPVGVVAAGVSTKMATEVATIEQVLAEPAIEPQDEDALSRLVREAMQRAVESAKGSEQG
ncbi:MAG: hypothetical protein OEY41_04865, partial [Acidimicrobiia bacterium]|nr:hypothetical protein [Acidimicrobiia bacterium]